MSFAYSKRGEKKKTYLIPPLIHNSTFTIIDPRSKYSFILLGYTNNTKKHVQQYKKAHQLCKQERKIYYGRINYSFINFCNSGKQIKKEKVKN